MGFLRDEEILEILNQHTLESLRHNEKDLFRLMKRSIMGKVFVVENDLKEKGL